MDSNDEFGLFLKSESEQERLDHLGNFMSSRGSHDVPYGFSTWHAMSSFPSKTELVRMAASLSISKAPDSSWVLASRLLRDADQDVVGNAINSITFSCSRSIGHRALSLFGALERPQRVLYCLARYAEEAIDRRCSHYLSASMQSDLSDAFLARSFNALFRLGRVDRLALNVAMDLVGSHIDATNMDRKAAVSAIVYLCFAGDREDLENLKSVQNKVTIPELRRLLNWGLYELNGFEIQDFDAQAAKNFLKRAANLAEPNFTGYGCFHESNLIAGAALFLKDLEPESYFAVTRTFLALGHPKLIDLLAEHKDIGLGAIAKNELGELRLLWKHYLPLHTTVFTQSIKNTSNFDFWIDRDFELLNVMLEPEDFLSGSWQELFLSRLEKSPEQATSLLVTQMLALERAQVFDTLLHHVEHQQADGEQGSESLTAFENLILDNFTKIEHHISKGRGQGLVRDELHNRIVSVMLGGHFSKRLVDGLLQPARDFVLGPELAAATLAECRIESSMLDEQIGANLARIERELRAPTKSLDHFVAWVVGTGFALLNLGSRAKGLHDLSNDLGRYAAICETLQAMIATIEASSGSPESDGDSDNSQDSSPDDWGQAIADRPLLRWNAIVQSCLNDSLSLEDRAKYEGHLRDAMKVAPHVDKRWAVCGLVRLGTDDAIKAILYQALQHVDGEFVAHTIKQLLRSSHRRAQQALIRSVGRNTIADELKLTILDEISLDNAQELLAELKTLEILRLPAHIDDAIRDAIGRVASAVGELRNPAPQNDEDLRRRSLVSADVDGTIKSLLPDMDSLSVDVRSALRTAEMILVQSKDWGSEGVDLSPIVNMHCKAVELVLRETFEGMTDAIIRRGELSRKLDILGYARPIPEKMQIFEDYLAQLPIVRSIPYFSKFKLRKMLRAICLYRPGKRFTLDGPKAFALLFLVGSRRECPFGLDQTIPLAFKHDHELFEFIKIVHSLQDSRNRAVHEGLTWEAQDEIDSLRSQAYQIISVCIGFSKEMKKRGSRHPSGLVGMGA